MHETEVQREAVHRQPGSKNMLAQTPRQTYSIEIVAFVACQPFD